MRLSKRILRARPVQSAVGALAVPAMALGQVAGSEGVKQGEKFAKAGNEVLVAVAEARRDVDATVTAYNNLVKNPSKDVKGDYKKLLSFLRKHNCHMPFQKFRSVPASAKTLAYHHAEHHAAEDRLVKTG